MMIDTKKVLIEDTIEMLAKAEDVLDMLLGTLESLDHNELLYSVVTDLHTDREKLIYIRSKLGGRE